MIYGPIFTCKDMCLHYVFRLLSYILYRRLYCCFYSLLVSGVGPLLYTLYLLLAITEEDFVSFISNSNKSAHKHLAVCYLPLLSQLCAASLWIHLQASSILSLLPCCRIVGVLTAPFQSPPLFIRLSWSKAKPCETSPAPGLPAALMALGRRHKQEDLPDLLSAAVTRCLQPASYQAQQPDNPLVPGCTRLRRWILKPATSNNSLTNLRIGELE